MRTCRNCDAPLVKKGHESYAAYRQRRHCDLDCFIARRNRERWDDRIEELRFLLESGRTLIDIAPALLPNSRNPVAALARQLYRHNEPHLASMFSRIDQAARRAA